MKGHMTLCTLYEEQKNVSRARTGHDGEDLLHELQVVGLMELRGVLAAAEHEQQLQE